MLRSEIAEMQGKEADLVTCVISSRAACEAALGSEAVQSSELQALRFEMEMLQDMISWLLNQL